MNAAKPFVCELILGVLVGAAWWGLIELRLRKFKMDQIAELDAAIAAQREQIAEVATNVTSTINAKIGELTADLAVKNEATPDIDLTDEIAKVKGLTSALKPLTDLADSLKTPPPSAPIVDTPADPVPIEGTPVEITPVEGTPSEATPIETAPVADTEAPPVASDGDEYDSDTLT